MAAPSDLRRRLWSAMGALQTQYGHFTSPVLIALFEPGHRKTIENYLTFLHGERVIEIASTEARRNGQTNCWRIVNPGDAPPHRRNAETSLGCKQAAMWTAMRALSTFTAREIAVTASTEDRPVPPT